MMFFLSGDVTANRLSVIRAGAENGITFLPRKFPVEIFRRPSRRIFLQITNNVCDTMRRFQARKNVNVIFHTANRFRNAT